jgi:isopentenyl phosphate kinase
MPDLIFLKLGGSLLTDKNRAATPRQDVLERLAAELAAVRAARPEMRLLVGHGSGSFGHVVGNRYGTRQGVRDAAGWCGFAETAAAAARLNRLVVDALLAAGVPVWPVQPSASARCHDGMLTKLDIYPLQQALEHGLVPLTYGDVALDDVRGGTIISTEEIFAFLSPRLHTARIVLLGVVDGVYSGDPLRDPAAHRWSRLTPADVEILGTTLGQSHGVDVTGGMLTKVRIMARLVQAMPGLVVQLASGEQPGSLRNLLLNPTDTAGTILSSS